MKLENIKVAIVTSKYNYNVTRRLTEGSIAQLKSRGIAVENIKLIEVPGAVEIPYAAKLLAKTAAYQAVICLGSVIQGETDHYDYVCQQVSYGCQKVMLDTEIPIIFGVLTTQNEQQALDRAGGRIGHKGVEAADAALAMISITKEM